MGYFKLLQHFDQRKSAENTFLDFENSIKCKNYPKKCPFLGTCSSNNLFIYRMRILFLL